MDNSILPVRAKAADPVRNSRIAKCLTNEVCLHSDLWLTLCFGTAAVQQNIYHNIGAFPFFSAVKEFVISGAADLPKISRSNLPVFRPDSVLLLLLELCLL